MLKLNKFKYFLSFFLVAVFFILLPIENAHGFVDLIVGGVSDMLGAGADVFLNGLILFLGLIAGLIIEIFMGFGNEILKFALDGVVAPTGEGSAVVTEGWNIVRNLANSALIIGLVIIAINIILGREEGKAKQTLVNFVIVALLINFTPLICGFFITGADIIADSFIGAGLSGDCANRIISVMHNIQENTTNPIFTIAGLIVLMGFALLYFAVCILYSMIFIVRAIVLWILIIASPIALATKVFPKSDVVMKFFPSVLHWEEWYKTFIQWLVIVIPASLFLFLANTSMQEIVATPINEGSIQLNSIQAIIQVTATALFSYLVPIIILLVGLIITISSGGQITAPIGAFANKAKTFATGYAKEAGKGIAGGYLEQRKSGKGRLESLRGLNFENRESGRTYFDSKIDSAKERLGFKNYETRRKEDGAKKDFDDEEQKIKQIKSSPEREIEEIERIYSDKIADASNNEDIDNLKQEKAIKIKEVEDKERTRIKNIEEKYKTKKENIIKEKGGLSKNDEMSLDYQKEKEIKDPTGEKEKIINEAISTAEKEIRIASTNGDISRVKDLKKKTALLLVNHDKRMLDKWEKSHDVSIQKIVDKMSGAEIQKEIGSDVIANGGVKLSESQIHYIQSDRGTTTHQEAVKKAYGESTDPAVAKEIFDSLVEKISTIRKSSDEGKKIGPDEQEELYRLGEEVNKLLEKHPLLKDYYK